MTTLLQQINYSIYLDIQQHPAWIGHVSGLYAEKLLRGNRTPYLYILRAGEKESDYYLTFVHADLSIRHQPFVVSENAEGWSFINGAGFGPLKNTSIDDVVHLIMHCKEGECTPFIVD